MTRRTMLMEIIDSVTFEIARVLQAAFDEIEYRLAKRALAVESKRKTKMRSREVLAFGEMNSSRSGE